MKHRRLISSFLGAALFLLGLTAPPTLAAPSGACYLTPSPNAIQTALANPFCLQINLNPGVYREHNLVINRDMVLRGSGLKNTIIDGMHQGGVFILDNKSASVVISDLGIRNGSAGMSAGGAIYSQSKLFVRSVRFLHNTAEAGGAIWGAGPLTSIQYSAFRGNSATYNGGAIAVFAGQATIDASTFASNHAVLYGGAIENYVGIPLDVTASTFKNNLTTDDSAGFARGGALFLYGPTIILYSRFTGNQTAGYGGAIETASQAVTYLWYSVFANNQAGTAGGAIDQDSGTLHVYFDTLESNIAPLGGAVAAEYGDKLLVSYSTFAKNQAAPITLPLRGGPPVPGSPDQSSPLRPPVNAGPAITGPAGGAVFAAIPALFLNTTFSDNLTTGNGGGLYASTSAALSFVTFSGNQAAAGGNIYAAGSNPEWVYLKNTLLNAGPSPNCAGANMASFFSYGGNLSSDHSCDSWLTLASDRKGVKPKLQALADNGGPTLTHALRAGSPAIDGAVSCEDAFGTAVSDDQRQFPRPMPPGAPCDIGAYEYQ